MGILGGMGRHTPASVAQGLLGPRVEAAHKGLTRNLEWSQWLLLTLEESKPFGFQFPSAHAPQSTQLTRVWHTYMLL